MARDDGPLPCPEGAAPGDAREESESGAPATGPRSLLPSHAVDQIGEVVVLYTARYTFTRP